MFTKSPDKVLEFNRGQDHVSPKEVEVLTLIFALPLVEVCMVEVMKIKDVPSK